MGIVRLILYSVFFALTLSVNDYEFRGFTCESKAMKTIEFRVCEYYKRQLSLDFTIKRPLNDWTVSVNIL